MAIQFWNNQILFVGGQIAMDPACCCDPCSCQDGQNDAVATVSGSCDYGCGLAAGTYVFSWFSGDAGGCQWVYRGPLVQLPGGRFVLSLNYTKATRIWTADAICGPEYFSFRCDDPPGITGIACNSQGKLTGSFQVPGSSFGLLADCSGCTLHVTLL